MKSVYSRFPGWREAPRAADSLLKPELRQMLNSKAAAKQNGAPNPNYVTPDDCAPAIATDVSNSDIAIAKGFEIAAEGVMEALPTDFLSFEGHAVAADVRAALQTVSLGLETSKNIKDDCTAPSKDDVQSIVDGAKSEIINNDNSNTSSIVSNDNTNTTTLNTAITNAETEIINNSNANAATPTHPL